MQYTFLMSSERSGSNLITRMIDSHSACCGPSPVHLLRLLLDHRARYGNLRDNANWHKILEDTVALFNSKTGIWKSKWNFNQLSNAVQQRTLAALLQTIYEKEARLNGKARLFIKENHLYRYLPFIFSAIPAAKIIYLARDPRDMALSWKLSPILRGSVIRAVNVWREDQQAALQVLDWLCEQEKIHPVRYEQLVAEPENELRQICSFLEIEFEYNMLEFSRNHQTVANAECASDWKNLQKPVMSKNFNKYRKGLSDEEIQYIEAACYREMDRLGYTRDFELAQSAGKLQEAITPLERQEKAEYLQVPLDERQLRQKRASVIREIEKRPCLPLTAMHISEDTSPITQTMEACG